MGGEKKKVMGQRGRRKKLLYDPKDKGRYLKLMEGALDRCLWGSIYIYIYRV
jgi:hypothetical protein